MLAEGGIVILGCSLFLGFGVPCFPLLPKFYWTKVHGVGRLGGPVLFLLKYRATGAEEKIAQLVKPIPAVITL